MKPSFVICSSCGCHVRAHDETCLACGTPLRAAGAVRAPLRKRIEVRRVLLVGAIAGVGVATACGGKVFNEDVQGSCAGASGGVALSCDYNGNCACGTGGQCDKGHCVSCGCEANQYCDGSGQCQSDGSGNDYWFHHGNLGGTHSCYGSPPFLG
jgi:hypothetical protein